MISALLISSVLGALHDEDFTGEYVRPRDYSSCALTSLYLVARLRDCQVEFQELKERLGPVQVDGTHSFAVMARAATDLGLHPVGVDVDRAALAGLPMPAIVQVRDNARPIESPHLLVILRVDHDGVVLLDPPMPAYFLANEQFRAVWTGKVLIFARDAQEERQVRWIPWVRRAAGLGLVLAVLAAFIGLSVAARTVVRNIDCSQLRKRAATVGALGSLLIIAGLALSNRGVPAPVGPRCELPQTVYHFRELNPGSFATEVTVKNTGTQPLTIHRIQSSCTCAVGKTPGIVPPGGSQAIPVELSVSPGPRQARLTIETDDPDGPKRAILTWYGQADPVLIPPRIIAHRAPADARYERIVCLAYPGGPFALTPILECVSCASGTVLIQTMSNDPSALHTASRTIGESLLHVTIEPPARPGRFETTCSLKVRLGDELRIIPLPIDIHFIGGELTPEVDSMTFSAVRPSDLVGLERSINVLQRSAGGVLEVVGLPAWLSCETESTSERSHLARFRVVALPEGNGQHQLRLMRKGEPRTAVEMSVHVFTP